MFSSTSTKISRILSMAIYFALSIHVLIKAFGISINEKSISSFAYIIHISSTDYVDTVVEMASSFEL